MDLSQTIVPKSDQLNADDLIAGPVTVTISDVVNGTAEQPVDVRLVEYPGRAYRPSKSMRRVLVSAWTADGALYAGRRLTLYRNPDIMFGRDKVGGIEIKSRNPIFDGTVPTANLAQIHACMFVLDRAWWDYVSYAGGWPLFVTRVHRDEKWDAIIAAALRSYEQTAADTIAAYTTAVAGRPIADRIDHFAEIEIS
jgi:hypothetical protein